MVTFPTKATPPKVLQNMLLMHGGLHTHIEAVATFLIVFEAHMNNFCIIEVKILVVIKWSYSSPSSLEREREIGIVSIF